MASCQPTKKLLFSGHLPWMNRYMLMMARTLLALLLLAILTGCANKTDPLQEPSLVLPQRASGDAMSLADVERCLMVAAELNGWLPEGGFDQGKLRADRRVRSHRALVDIIYDEESVAVRYADSTNLNYSDRPGSNIPRYKEMNYQGPVIHPHYNRWIEALVNDFARRVQHPDVLCQRAQGIRAWPVAN